MQSRYSDSLDLLPTQYRLCKACQTILHFNKTSHFHLPQVESINNVPPAAVEIQAHHGKETDMYQAAQNGCCVCSVLWRRWITKCQEDPNLTASPELSEAEDDRDDDEDICSSESDLNSGDDVDSRPTGFSRVEVEGTLDSGYDVRFEMRTRERQTWSGALERGDHILAPVLDPELSFHTMDFGHSTSSHACWALARHWLEQCQAKHQACHISTETSYCPTRLIEVKCDSSGYRLRLVSGITNLEVIGYVTLSHCWGAIQPLTLKIENLDDFTQDMAFHALPQTFRDAVSATYQLGYQYLWIDSLCVIQDSEQDWQKEAADMMKVYRHCTLNLSAKDSKNSTEGLFFQHRMRDVKPLVWQSRCKDTPDRLFFLCPTGFGKTSGAWVMQEKLLALRILHFGKRQLFWECQEFRGCETAPGGIGPQISGGSLAPNLPNQIMLYQEKTASTHGSLGAFVPKNWNPVHPFYKFDGYHGADGSDPFDSLDRIWKEIVTKYTRCGLTKPSDKLIAISGLAKSLQLAYGGEYCAGLWKTAIVGQLAWIVQGGGRRPESSRAPTWTWASLDGAIRFPIEFTARETIDQASLESVDITPLTRDTFGALNDGILRLRGRLYRAMVSDGGHDCSELTFETAACEMRVWNTMMLDAEPTTATKVLYCMPVRASKPSVGKIFAPTCWFLLLRPASHLDEAYERCGLLKTTIALDGISIGPSSAHVLGLRIDILKKESERTRFYGSDRLSVKQEINERYLEHIITII